MNKLVEKFKGIKIFFECPQHGHLMENYVSVYQEIKNYLNIIILLDNEIQVTYSSEENKNQIVEQVMTRLNDLNIKLISIENLSLENKIIFKYETN